MDKTASATIAELRTKVNEQLEARENSPLPSNAVFMVDGATLIDSATIAESHLIDSQVVTVALPMLAAVVGPFRIAYFWPHSLFIENYHSHHHERSFGKRPRKKSKKSRARTLSRKKLVTTHIKMRSSCHKWIGSRSQDQILDTFVSSPLPLAIENWYEIGFQLVLNLCLISFLYREPLLVLRAH